MAGADLSTFSFCFRKQNCLVLLQIDLRFYYGVDVDLEMKTDERGPVTTTTINREELPTQNHGNGIPRAAQAYCPAPRYHPNPTIQTSTSKEYLGDDIRTGNRGLTYFPIRKKQQKERT